MKYLSFLVFFCTSFFSLFFFPAHNAQAAHAKKEDRTDIEKVAVRKSFETEFWKAEFNPYTSLPDQWWLKEYLEEPSQSDATLKSINLLEGARFQVLVEPEQEAIIFKNPIASDYLHEAKDRVWSISEQINDLQIISMVSQGGHYKLMLGIYVKNLSSSKRMVHPGLQIRLNPQEGQNKIFPSFRRNDEIVRLKNIAKEDGLQQLQGTYPWIALENRHFIYALYPESASDFQHQIRYGYEQDDILIELRQKPTLLSPGKSHACFFWSYLGPKKRPYLYKGEANLSDIPIYGFVVKKIYNILLKFHTHLNNWGLALTLFAIAMYFISYIVLYSFFHRSKNRLWPLYMQLPIFFALFSITYYGIEFRHAPLLFYQDLSAPDPYFLLPLLTGLAFFALLYHSRQTNATTQSQTKLGLLATLCLISVALCAFLPLGLLCYIFITVLVAFFMQYLKQKKTSQ